MEWIIQLPILCLSVVIHELAHGLTAWSRGDTTAEDAGRLTLNPIPHIDPFGTVFLPALCFLLQLPLFAWAKPVPVNHRRLRGGRRDVLFVALAGPLANVALAVIGALVYRGATVFAPWGESLQRTLMDAAMFTTTLNLFLAFFNLLPIQPLDGSNIFRGLLPSSWRAPYDRLAPYGMAVLVVLLMTHWLQPLVIAPSQAALSIFSRIGLIG